MAKTPIDLRMFNLDNLIERLKRAESYFDVIDWCNKEATKAESFISRSTRDEQYTIQSYSSAINEFVFFLQYKIASGKSKENIRRFMPVMQNLIEKGQMSKDHLKLLE